MKEYTDIIETENRAKKRENCESEIIRNNGKDRGDKMMEHMEMVEKLREKANISIEEAKAVLEKNNWDMLDALIELERQGKITDGVKMSTENQNSAAYETVSPTVTGQAFEEEAGGSTAEKKNRGKIKRTLKQIFRMSIDNSFVVKRNEEVLIRVPVIIPIACAVASFWITAIVLFVGLIFGLKYSFEGRELGKDTINDTMEKASDFAQNIVDEIKE